MARDREQRALPLGMSGGVFLPAPITRTSIRRDGKRRGLSGDELEDFALIVVAIDNEWLVRETEKVSLDLKTQAANMRSKQPRG